jgi:hypothetical protein
MQQDATVKQALGKVNLTHRYMLEERFVHNASKVTLENATTFYLRFRYRVQADYTLEERKYYLKGIVSDEIMINGGNKIIKTHLIKTESMRYK